MTDALHPLTPEQIAALAAALGSVIAKTVTPATLKQNESWAYCRLSRTEWYRLKSMGKLPAPAKLGGEYTRWLRKDLDEWLEKQKG